MFDLGIITDGMRVTEGLPEPYVFSLAIKARDYETDSQGIVNNANYLHYLEMTRHAFCEHRGYPFPEMTADGIIAVLRRIEIEYVSSLHGGEIFLSCLWVERTGPRFVFHQDLYSPTDGKIIAKAVATVVATKEGHLTKGDELALKLKIH